jgi:hypothetical protein
VIGYLTYFLENTVRYITVWGELHGTMSSKRNLLIKLELEENNIPFIKLPLYPVLVCFLLNVVLCFNEVLFENVEGTISGF